MRKFVLIFAASVIILPVFMVLLLSFFSYYRFPMLFPGNFTLDFWVNTVINNRGFHHIIFDSMIIGIFNGLFSTFIGIMTGRALVRYKFFGRRILKSIFSLPLFIPAIAFFTGVHLVMIKFHLINSMAGVIISHMLVSIPYAASIFITFFQGINPDMENVARTLGCSKMVIYTKILLPLLSPGIYLSFSIGFLISFSEYFSTFLIGGGKVITLATMMYPYINNGDLGNGSVLGVVFVTVNILVFFIADYLSHKNLKIESYLFE
jgi:putative spermidine/putrescine transport system permease protein